MHNISYAISWIWRSLIKQWSASVEELSAVIEKLYHWIMQVERFYWLLMDIMGYEPLYHALQIR